jgi:hypothetical protein
MASYSPALKRIYGSNESEVRANLVPVKLTWLKGDGKSAQTVTVKVNKHVMAARLRNVNTQMVAYTKAHHVGYTLRQYDSFCWRLIRGGTGRSMHSGACALDLNWDQNPMTSGPLVTDQPLWMRNILKANGFAWGGDFSRHDAMHWEVRIHTEPAAAVPLQDWWWVSFRTKKTGNAGLVEQYARLTLGVKCKLEPRADGSVAFLAHCSGKTALKLADDSARHGIVSKVQQTGLDNSDVNFAAVLKTE